MKIFFFIYVMLGFQSIQASSDCGFFDANCWNKSSLNPKMIVTDYDPKKAFNGTTMFALEKKTGEMAIIEVDMQGNIVWQYVLPDEIAGDKKNKLHDVEYLENGNILFLVRSDWDWRSKRSLSTGDRLSMGTGIFEVTRDKEIVWRYADTGATADVDRLSNGNTIWVRSYVSMGEPHVIEVNTDGEVVWQWDAMDEFDVEPFSEIFRGGWLHANAVTRLDNGNTLISLRNLDMIVEVDNSGKTVWSQKYSCLHPRLWEARGRGYYGGEIHEKSWLLPEGCNPIAPEVQSNGNILISVRRPSVLYETSRDGDIVWEFPLRILEDYLEPTRARDVDRLPNGNTLVQVDSKIFELTPEEEIVWLLDFPEIPWSPPVKMRRFFENNNMPKDFWKQFKYNQLWKAQRIPAK